PIVLVVEPRPEAALAEPVEAAHALERVVPHPVLVGQLVQASQSSLGGVNARLGLLLGGDPVVLEAEQADHAREGEPLDDERGERESRIGRSCRPTRPNSSALSRKTRISHTASPCSLVWTVVSSGVYQPT